MAKKKTPVSTVIFYIIGIILLIVALFMLWTAVNYTKTYLASYDASFKDMWTNSMQYIITQVVPYLGMGVICIGLGRAIYGTANARAVQEAETAEETAESAEAAETSSDSADQTADAQEAKEAPAAEAAEPAKAAAASAGDGQISATQFSELIRQLDMNREVLSIKIEEKEKRDSFRIKELEKKVDGFLSDVKYINEPLEELVYKQAAGIDDGEIPPVAAAAAAKAATTEPAEPAAEATSAAGAVPQVFTVSRIMTAPACPAAAAEPAAETAAEATSAAGAVPQIFTVSRRMTAPACPAAAAKAAAEDAAEPAAAGAVPQIFTVSRRMTAPACPAAKE